LRAPARNSRHHRPSIAVNAEKHLRVGHTRPEDFMKKTTLALACAGLLIAGCATSNPDVVQRYETQRLSQVQEGTVLSVRNVVIDGTQSGLGGATGAMIGGIAGSTRSSGAESAVISLVAAVVGGMMGNAIERGATREDGVELLVQLRNGERRSIVQSRGHEALVAGEAVVLVTTDGRTRVTRAPAIAPTARPANG
jgi:outer membrane lipoprotein SlyB